MAGCLEYPGSFTFGRQPLDRITHPWLVQRRNPAISPHIKGKNITEERTTGRGRGKENWLKKRSWRSNAAGRKLHTLPNQLRDLVNYRACSHLPQTTPMNCIYSKNRLLFSARHEKVAITFKTQIKLNPLPRRSHKKNDVDEYIVKKSLICDHT